MKYLILCCTIIINSFVYSQEFEKSGELLENELSLSETEINKFQFERQGNFENKKVQRFRNQSTDWNYNEQSEVFLRILDYGRFTVEIDDQLISNSTGKFRFFDLNPGLITIKIYSNDFLIYRVRLQIRRNTRTILDYFYNEGLYLVDAYKLNKYSPEIGNWEDPWNSIFNNNPNHWNNYYAMNPEEFKSYMNALKRESFDDDKINFILSTSKGVFFTAEQVKDILKTFSFEDDKLKVAKKLSHQIIDRKNLYKIYDAFTFSDSKEKLRDYILNSK